MDFINEISFHFLVAAVTGLLGYWSISTMRSVLLRVTSHYGRLQISTDASRGMIISSLLVALSLALLSHMALDAYWAWWTTPLNTPLSIIIR